jgi:DNA-binding ferritin-like protein
VGKKQAEAAWERAKGLADRSYKKDSKAYWPVVMTITKSILGLNEEMQAVEGGSDDCMQRLFGLLLAARTVAQIQHWQTRSFAQHLALQELYTTIDLHVDKLAEAYMGACGAEIRPCSACLCQTSPPEFARDLQSQLDDLSHGLPGIDHLQNLYQELQSAVATALYKLERLT